MRTQIFRLRKFLEEITLSYRLEDCLKITFGGGYYTPALWDPIVFWMRTGLKDWQEGNALKRSRSFLGHRHLSGSRIPIQREYLAENPYQEWTLVAGIITTVSICKLFSVCWSY